MPYLLTHFFIFLSSISRLLFFCSSIFVILFESHLSPNPNIPTSQTSSQPYIQNLVTTTLLRKKSDTLISLLNSDTLILSLLSPLSHSFVQLQGCIFGSTTLCKFLETISSYLLISALIVNFIFIFNFFFLHKINNINLWIVFYLNKNYVYF